MTPTFTIAVYEQREREINIYLIVLDSITIIGINVYMEINPNMTIPCTNIQRGGRERGGGILIIPIIIWILVFVKINQRR